MHYVGTELDLFAHAKNWKKYWSSEIQPFLTGDVLEAGAGLGTNTKFLKSERINSWTCLEPDNNLQTRMRDHFLTEPKLRDCRVVSGTVESLAPREQFDAIIYIDVLEHIEDDRGEMEKASKRLRTDGKIIVIAPAHQTLYTPFDRDIGHFRRYNRASLSRCTPHDCRIDRILYLDSAGLLASLGNRVLLKQSNPSLGQILFWDRVLIPLSTILDRISFHTLGKSILGIWKKA